MCVPDCGAGTMKDEISAAVLFLTRLIRKSEKLKEEQVETFKTCLYTLLTERFKDHWFPQNPCKGQAYRCIRVNETERRDPILEEAARKCGLNYEDLELPVEMTIWVDPHEVCCRFGEHKGSYCTVASFKNGNKENFVDKINVDALEQKTAVIIKKASYEAKKRKNAKSSSSPRKNGYNRSFISQQNILQQLPALSPSQNFRTPVFPVVQSSSYQRILPPAPNFSFAGSNPTTQSSRSASLFHRAGPQFGTSLTQPHMKLGRSFGAHLPVSSGTNSSSALSSIRYSAVGKNDRYHWNKKSIVKS